MGLSTSFLLSAWTDILRSKFFGLVDNVETVIVRSLELDGKVGEMNLRMINFRRDLDTNQKSAGSDEITTAGSDEITIEEFISFPNQGSEKLQIETTVSFKNPVLDKTNFNPVDFIAEDDDSAHRSKSSTLHSEPGVILSQRTASELDAAAIKLQKVYKSYRTRRNLADCAVVVEELWWKVLDFAALKQSSVSFFNIDKPETAVSRWARAGTRVAKVGKGLSKDENARKLALQHWLEAIDPRHRYGHNLHLYYDFWFDSESAQPFFYWLDVGDGKEVNLEKCPRNELQHQCIKYLGQKEREAYEVVMDGGKLVYKQSGLAVDTYVGSKWIFVLSTSRSLYVGQKQKSVFQHSSFLAGAATTAAGRLVAHNGVLEAIWPYSGHYLPTEENFNEFINFLEDHHVDLTNVKRCSINAESPSFRITDGEDPSGKIDEPAEETNVEAEAATETPAFDLGKLKLLSCKWSTGAGPRIGCIRDYPTELRFQALEHVNLSPRSTCGPSGTGVPIPSPRPSPKVRLSPRLSYMGIPSPRASVPNSSSQFL